MDFVHDRAANNQPLKFLTMVDHCTRQMPGLVVRSRFKGADVAATLERLLLLGSKPETLVVENGPEFRSRSLQRWATLNGVRLYFIEPGNPSQNGYIELLNGKFRAEYAKSKGLAKQENRELKTG